MFRWLNERCTFIFKDNKRVVSFNGVQFFTAALRRRVFAVSTVTQLHTGLVPANDGLVGSMMSENVATAIPVDSYRWGQQDAAHFSTTNNTLQYKW